MLRIFSAYGRARRMRSWALRILETEIISIALVIFFVLSKFLILPRISLPVAIEDSFFFLKENLLGEGLLEGGCGSGQLGLGVLVHRLVGFEFGQQGGLLVRIQDWRGPNWRRCCESFPHTAAPGA